MADEDKKPEAAEEAAPAPKPKKSLVTFGVFGGVMLVEGIAIFLSMRFLGSDPDPTKGMVGLEQPTTQPWAESKELEVASLRVLNRNGPRLMLYNVHVVITVHHSDVDAAQSFLESRASTIEDTMSRVIRSAEEKHLAEPGLETIRRQLKHELHVLIGDETTIEQVLIPEFTQLPTGY